MNESYQAISDCQGSLIHAILTLPPIVLKELFFAAGDVLSEEKVKTTSRYINHYAVRNLRLGNLGKLAIYRPANRHFHLHYYLDLGDGVEMYVEFDDERQLYSEYKQVQNIQQPTFNSWYYFTALLVINGLPSREAKTQISRTKYSPNKKSLITFHPDSTFTDSVFDSDIFSSPLTVLNPSSKLISLLNQYQVLELRIIAALTLILLKLVVPIYKKYNDSEDECLEVLRNEIIQSQAGSVPPMRLLASVLKISPLIGFSLQLYPSSKTTIDKLIMELKFTESTISTTASRLFKIQHLLENSGSKIYDSCYNGLIYHFIAWKTMCNVRSTQSEIHELELRLQYLDALTLTRNESNTILKLLNLIHEYEIN